MPPAAATSLSTATPAVVLADEPRAEQVVLGLPNYMRALLAAQHAGCAPLILVVDEAEGARLGEEVVRESRLSAPVELLDPITWASRQAKGSWPVVVEAGAVVDSRALLALAEGQPSASYFGPELTRAVQRRRLLRTLANPIDGLVDTWINRPISRLFTRALTPTGISPNAVTVISTLIGLAGAAAIASGHYETGIAGALLFQLAAAVDCTDGEIARLTYRFSPLGAKLDLGLDNVVYGSIFAALGVASIPALGAQLALGLGGLAVLGQVCSWWVVWQIWFHPRPGDDDPRLRGLLDRLTNRDFSLAVIAVSVLGWWHVLLVAVAFGTHVFWVAMALIARRARRAAA